MARSGEELARRRETARALLDEAKGALAAAEPEQAIASLERALQVPPTLDLVEEIASLASAARKLQSELQASRLAKQEGKTRRRRVHEVKKRAEARQAAKYAAAQCSTAAAKYADAETLFSDDKFGEALGAFDDAIHAYELAEVEAQRARLRELRAVVAAARTEADAEDAAEHASGTWMEAHARAGAGDTAAAGDGFEEACEAFQAAISLFKRALEETRVARNAASAVSSTEARAKDETAALELTWSPAPEDERADKPPSEGDQRGEPRTFTGRVAYDNAIAVGCVAIAVVVLVAAFVPRMSRETAQPVVAAQARAVPSPPVVEAASVGSIAIDPQLAAKAKAAAEIAAEEEKAATEARAAAAEAKAAADSQAVADANAFAVSKAADESDAAAQAKAAARAKVAADAEDLARIRAAARRKTAEARAAAETTEQEKETVRAGKLEDAHAARELAAQNAAARLAAAKTEERAEADARILEEARAEAEAEVAAEKGLLRPAVVRAAEASDENGDDSVLPKKTAFRSPAKKVAVVDESVPMDSDAEPPKNVPASEAEAAARADALIAAAAARSEEESRAAARRLVDESRGVSRRSENGEPQSKPIELASAKPLPESFSKSHVVIFAEGTDGHRGGGGWGVCWRGSSSDAQACAREGCKKSDHKLGCQTASTGPGGHCAIAKASGFGISWPACGASVETAKAEALAGCSNQLKQNYGKGDACGVVWTSATH